MGLIIYLGHLLGVWLDTKFETNFLEETLTIIAVFGAMFSVVYRINKFNAKDK